MVFFLILGVVLGGAAILFILQNISPITVTFFAWHLNGSLALVLFLALFAGMLITILLLLPSYVSDEFKVSKLKKQNKDLADELAATKQHLADLSTRTGAVSAPVAAPEPML